MAKLYEHWCDKEHEEKPDDKKHFEIGEMAKGIYDRIEKYLLHDLSKTLNVVETEVERNYIIKKLYNILDTVEKMENYAQDANSIFAVYGVDYEERRRRWLAARGYSFQLVAQLDHITNILVKKTNSQKFVDESNELYKLAAKIKNVMIADDKKKKKYCKEYMPKT